LLIEKLTPRRCGSVNNRSVDKQGINNQQWV
jgi:hypothetical protein